MLFEAGKDRQAYPYVITGGPGSGKSTLLNVLSERGYCCFEEVSRRLIKEQAALGNGIMPWDNLPAFAELAVEAMVQQYRMSQKTGGICFFDRAIPDVFGYLMNSGFSVPPGYKNLLEVCRYQHDVFILPPWPDIYEQDDERPQTYDEAVSIYHALCKAYDSCGFTLHDVPKSSVEKRVAFIEALAVEKRAL